MSKDLHMQCIVKAVFTPFALHVRNWFWHSKPYLMHNTTGENCWGVISSFDLWPDPHPPILCLTQLAFCCCLPWLVSWLCPTPAVFGNYDAHQIIIPAWLPTLLLPCNFMPMLSGYCWIWLDLGIRHMLTLCTLLSQCTLSSVTVVNLKLCYGAL